MVGLEYTAFNINLVCGFVCTLLGFFVYFNIGEVGKIASFAGLGTGIVGFVLTLVYVIESGLVFNDDDGEYQMRIDSDGAFLKWNSKKNHYTCIFYKKDDYDSIYLRYSDLGNKYLNYYKDVRPEEKNYKYRDCKRSSLNYFDCKRAEENEYSVNQVEYSVDQSQSKGKCDKLLYTNEPYYNDNLNKVIYDRWLTSIIFSCFIFLLDIGLAIFGFLNLSESKSAL